MHYLLVCVCSSKVLDSSCVAGRGRDSQSECRPSVARYGVLDTKVVSFHLWCAKF